MAGERRTIRREPPGAEGHGAVPRGARSPANRVLSLQRSAGNRAVRALVARYTTREARERGAQIAEERGMTGQGAKFTAEGGVQLGATEREVERRAAEMLKKRGGGPQDIFDEFLDRALAAAEIRAEFTCDRLADWTRLTTHATLWKTKGLDPKAVPSLQRVQSELMDLTTLLLGPDLKAQRRCIEAAESAIDAFVKDWGGTAQERADLLLAIKRYTLGHERRKLLIAERIVAKYGIRLDTMELIKANKKAYGGKKLEKFVEMQEPEVFSLEELKAIETVLQRYAPMLGKNRAKKQGAQPLTVFGRAKYGIDYDDTGVAERDPDTRGESFAKSKTVGMYDEGASASQFPTGMQQFRGTFAHELSHALIEDFEKSKGKRMLDLYLKATGVWADARTTPYRKPSNAETWQEMKNKGKEPPITEYGAYTAQEDLADAIKFLFEDPAKLKQECPIRYKWILQNLGPVFEATWFSSLPSAPP
jgi:hypothetical protein